jgi:hypothetical protein
MNQRAKKFLMLFLAGVMLFSAGRVQNSLNADRTRLGLTYTAVLQNAPPMLAFTTVALGSFRGLISNFLWSRANDLQQDGKYFEAAQLASWITDLEPHFTQVWIFQGWNMSYNISVKFKENKAADENGPADYTDRWRWVQRGISLMRDEGLKYNPDDVLIFRELAWQYQHKIGANLDDANMFYKMKWATEMSGLFGEDGTNLVNLVSPAPGTADWTNAMVLKEKYKLDPAFIKQVDDKYGPFDWRLPEAHAVYWGAKGLDQAQLHPDHVKPDDLITLRRIIYQSTYQAFKHGRITYNPFTRQVSLEPNLDLAGRVNEIYETMFKEETQHDMRDGILRAQRNFLRDAIYFLYQNAHTAEAAKWFKYLGEKFPDKPIVENDPTSLPKTLTLDEYAVAVTQIDIQETSQERVTSAIEGLVYHAFLALVEDDDARYQTMMTLAQRVHAHYDKATSTSRGATRIPLLAIDQIKRNVASRLLDPERGVAPEARAILRTRLGLPPETVTPPSTNAVPAVSTNSVSTNAAPVALP